MRILIASPYYFPYTSGMTVYAQRLAEGLAKRGHEVRVLTYNHAGLPAKEKINGVEIFRVPALVKFGRGIFSHKMLQEFSQILKWADVVNIHAPFFECGLLAKLAHLNKKRIFLTYHCDLVLTGWVAPFLIGRLHRFSVECAAKYSEKIFVNSIDYAEHSYIRKFLHKTIEVPPPLDDSRFKKVSSEKFRRKYNLGKNDFVAGFLGRLTYEKGLEHIIDAAKLLSKKIPNLKILIAGEGVLMAGGKSESMLPKLKQKIKNLQLENIIFAGKIPDAELNKFFSSLDVFVLPSINRLESFGMVQVEAMLCGAPVVASGIDISLMDFSVRNLMLGIFSRKIYEARTGARRKEETALIAAQEAKTVPMTWIIIDEAHNFLPSENMTAATEPMLTLVRQGRQPGISLVLITQRPNKLHEDAIAQADLIIAHRLTSKPDIDALSAVMQTYLLDDIKKSISDMPKTKGAAVLLDDNSERLFNIQVRPRQSWHAGGSPTALKEKKKF